MSINYFDKDTNKWTKVASLLASSMSVIDIAGNYTSSEVEGCLREVANSLKDKIDDVQLVDKRLDFYANGLLKQSIELPLRSAIVGDFLCGELNANDGLPANSYDAAPMADGTVWEDYVTPVNARNLNKIESKLRELATQINDIGSNTAPEVSSTFTQTKFKPNEPISIPYYVYDAEDSVLTALYTMNGRTTEKTISAGNNVWNIGVVPNGAYNLVLAVKDKKLTSRPIIWNAEVGGLELTSNFRSDDEFEIGKDIVVPYSINQLTAKEVTVERIVDGVKTIVKEIGGAKIWRISGLSVGVHKISITAHSDDGEMSNTLNWQVVVSSGESLFIASDTRTDLNIGLDERLIIPYRVYMKNQDRFKVEYTIDGDRMSGNAVAGLNSWNIGLLPFGTHELTIKVLSPVPSYQDSNVLRFDVVVNASDFTPAEPVQDNLLFWFNADKKDNSLDGKEKWEDKSGNNVNVEFHNVNYVANGWIDGWLNLDGNAYAYIDTAPLKNDVGRYGFSFDIRFKYTQLGNPNAKTVSCMDPIPPHNGFAIDTQWGYLSGSGLNGTVPVVEEEDIRMTFVIDRQRNQMVTYLNGISCDYVLMSGTPVFTYGGKIYLNCDVDEHGVIQNLSECKIKEIIAYDKALSSDEVLQNFQSGLTINEQKDFIVRNLFLSKEDEEATGKKSTLPRLDVYGDFAGMEADVQKDMEIDLDPKVTEIQALEKIPVKVDWQGSSSLIYTIKNYNFDMYDPFNPASEYDIVMKPGWWDFNSYHIKANFIDSSHAYNLGFINHLYKCYNSKTPGMILEEQKPEEERRPIRYGVDGFPVIMYQNDKPHGVYTWNLKNHRHIWGMDRSKPEQQMFRCESNTGDTAKFLDWQDMAAMKIEWEEREPRTGNYNDLQEVIRWVVEATDEEFVRDLEQHFNKEFLLTYYILMIAFGAVDSTCKNLLMCTWGRGSQGHAIWYPMWYDCDTLLGCDNQGNYKRWTPQVNFPSDYNAPDQRLWLRVQKLLQPDLKLRYRELRDEGKGLRVNEWKESMEYITKRIGERYYNWDSQVKYLPTGSSEDLMKLGGNKLLWSLKWFKERLTYCDDLFEYSGVSEKRIIFRTYTGGRIRIGIQTVLPQRITVSFSDKMEHAMITKKCDQDTITYFEWDYAGDSSLHICYITNGDLIQRITGFNDADIDSLVLEHCERLLELECKNNPRLPTLTFQNSPRLTSVDISGCTGIAGTLDFNASRSLKHLNISHTGVTTLNISSSLYLETLDISYSKMIQLSLDNQQNISSVVTEGCENLAILSLQNCPKITSFVTTDMISLTTLRLRGCANLEELFISHTPRLANLDYRDCPHLKYFTSENVPITSFEFSNLEELELINVGGSTNLSSLTLTNLPKLTMLDVEGTSINRLDLTGTTSQFGYVNFRNSSVEQIINLNVYIKSKMDTSVFEGCDGLISVTGLMRFGSKCESAANLFNGLHKLTTIPTIQLDDTIKSVAGMFKFCDSLTYINLGNSNTNKLEDMTELFYNCSSLQNVILNTWNTENVTKFANAFYKVPKDARIEISDEWYVSESMASFDGKFWRAPYTLAVGFTNTRILATDFFTNCFFDDASDDATAMPYNDPRLSYTVKKRDGRYVNSIDGLFTDDIKVVKVTYNNELKRVSFGDINSLNGREAILKALYYIDTQSFTSIKNMFSGCINITSIDLNAILNNNITDMSFFATNCVALKDVVSNLAQTDSILTMESAFMNCSSLTSLDFSKFSADYCINHEKMFSGCTKLQSLNIVRLNMLNSSGLRMLENVPNSTVITVGYYMGAITEANLSWYGKFTDNRLTSSAPSVSADDVNNVVIGLTTFMDYSYDNRVWIKYTGSNPPNVSSMYADVKLYVRFSGTVTHKPSEVTMLTFTPPPPYLEFELLPYFNPEATLANTIPDMFSGTPATNAKFYYKLVGIDDVIHEGNGTELQSIKGIKSFTVYYDSTVVSIKCPNKVSYFNYIDISKFTSLRDFAKIHYTNNYQSNFTGINTKCAGWQPGKITTVEAAFSGTKITSMDLEAETDWSSLTSTYSLFEECRLLETVTLNRMRPVKLQQANNMFYNCYKLREIDLSQWVCTNIVATRMFFGCGEATLIDVSGITISYSEYSQKYQSEYMFTGVPATCVVKVSANFGPTEADCGFAGTFTRV